MAETNNQPTISQTTEKEGEGDKSKGREERTKKKKEPKEDKETDRYGRTRRRASGASIGGKIEIQKREKKEAYKEITKRWGHHQNSDM